jgi:hypothetical protein
MTFIQTDGLTFLGPGSEWFWTAFPNAVSAVANFWEEMGTFTTGRETTRAGDPQGGNGTGWHEVSLSDGSSGWISSRQLSDVSRAHELPGGPCAVWSTSREVGPLPEQRPSRRRPSLPCPNARRTRRIPCSRAGM